MSAVSAGVQDCRKLSAASTLGHLEGNLADNISKLSLLPASCRRSYEHFCACGKMLDGRLEELGAQRFVPRTDVNREDWPAVDVWLAGIVAGLRALRLQPASETGVCCRLPAGC